MEQTARVPTADTPATPNIHHLSQLLSPFHSVANTVTTNNANTVAATNATDLHPVQDAEPQLEHIQLRRCTAIGKFVIREGR